MEGYNVRKILLFIFMAVKMNYFLWILNSKEKLNKILKIYYNKISRYKTNESTNIVKHIETTKGENIWLPINDLL